MRQSGEAPWAGAAGRAATTGCARGQAAGAPAPPPGRHEQPTLGGHEAQAGALRPHTGPCAEATWPARSAGGVGLSAHFPRPLRTERGASGGLSADLQTVPGRDQPHSCVTPLPPAPMGESRGPHTPWDGSSIPTLMASSPSPGEAGSASWGHLPTAEPGARAGLSVHGLPGPTGPDARGLARSRLHTPARDSGSCPCGSHFYEIVSLGLQSLHPLIVTL